MKFSTKTSYGLRAVALLAKNHRTGSLSLPLIAKVESISLKYLERIFADLKKAKIVKALKGVSGGYMLSKPPHEISALDVIQAIEGGHSAFHCVADEEKKYCNQGCKCGAADILIKLQDSIYGALNDIKLNNL